MIYVGECTEVLKTLQENSVDCCVTSPPYYRMRNYEEARQIGMEETPEEYIVKLVAIFAINEFKVPVWIGNRGYDICWWKEKE